MVGRGSAEPVAMPRARRGVRWSHVEGYFFVAPFFVGFLLFTLGPFVAALVMSFMKWGLFGSPEFVGLQNYRLIFTDDPKFTTSLINTLYYMAGHIPLAMMLAFAVALMLNRKVAGMPLFRTMYYLPSVTASVAIYLLWGWIFDPSFGLLNQGLELIGIEGPNWLGTTAWAMPDLMR